MYLLIIQIRKIRQKIAPSMSSSIKIRDTSQIEINLKEQGKIDGRYYTLDQKHDTMECLFCCFCEGSNEYAIAQSDPNYKVLSKKGYIREDSDCLSRVVCVCNRPFSAKMKLFNEEIAVAQRPCRCWLQWVPCAENQLVVTGKTGRIIGYIRIPARFCGGNIYSCSDIRMELYSGQNQELLYSIQGSYCQKSIFFPCFRLCYCPNIEYMICDKMNMKVGKIINIYNGCITECFSRTSKFGLQLPIKADEDQKILLLYAAMYLDYLRYQTPYFCLGIR